MLWLWSGSTESNCCFFFFFFFFSFFFQNYIYVIYVEFSTLFHLWILLIFMFSEMLHRWFRHPSPGLNKCFFAYYGRTKDEGCGYVKSIPPPHTHTHTRPAAPPSPPPQPVFHLVIFLLTVPRRYSAVVYFFFIVYRCMFILVFFFFFFFFLIFWIAVWPTFWKETVLLALCLWRFSCKAIASVFPFGVLDGRC